MAAPWRSEGYVSMRQASTTMSWLAERKATNAARARERNGKRAGSESANSAAAAVRAGWMAISQPRRRPSFHRGPGAWACDVHPLPPPPSREGRGWSLGDIGVAFAERTLHGDDVEPAAEFDAGGPHCADHMEAEACMHAD